MFNEEAVPWQKAANSCVTLGGYLASDTDSTIHGFFNNRLTSLGWTSAWLGAAEESSDYWFWLDGTPLGKFKKKLHFSLVNV